MKRPINDVDQQTKTQAIAQGLEDLSLSEQLFHSSDIITAPQPEKRRKRSPVRKPSHFIKRSQSASPLRRNYDFEQQIDKYINEYFDRMPSQTIRKRVTKQAGDKNAPSRLTDLSEEWPDTE